MAARKPHILILMTDQQRADCLSAAGHPHVKTPNMDSLAQEGVRFTRVYTTSPVCMPARSSFLSGLYCHNHGQWGNYGSLPADVDTYLRHAKAAGYRTCHVGKSHLYPQEGSHHLNEQLPYMHALGWDDVVETTGPWATVNVDSIMTDHWRTVGCLDTYRDDYAKRREVQGAATWPSPMPTGEHLDDFIGRQAVRYVNEYDRKEPLLLFVGFGGPHEPWDPPKDYAERYNPATMDVPKPGMEPGPWVPPEAAQHQRTLQNPQKKLTDDVYKQIRALYFAKISHIDTWFGEIIGAFKKKGFWENTTVIFWSDHGEMLGDKYRLFKSVFYEESVHVPLIIRQPGCPAAGKVSPSLVQQTDVFPTILELAGCPPKQGAFGKSLVPLLSEPEEKLHDAVFSEIGRRVMIRDAGHKMVVGSSGAVLKLYDLIADPHEEINVLGKNEYQGQVVSMKERLLNWYLATPSRIR